MTNEREYAVAVIDALLDGLRKAMITHYLPEKILANARSTGHSLYQSEILEETGETLAIKLEITLSGGHKR